MKKIITAAVATVFSIAFSTTAMAHEGDHAGESLGGLVQHSLFDVDHLLMLAGAALIIGSGVAMFIRSVKQSAQDGNEKADKH